jgi:hypothetical protein
MKTPIKSVNPDFSGGLISTIVRGIKDDTIEERKETSRSNSLDV